MKGIAEMAFDITEDEMLVEVNVPGLSTWVAAALIVTMSMGSSLDAQKTSLYQAFVLGRQYERELRTTTFVVVE